MEQARARAAALLCGAVTVAALFTWQFLTVHFNYGGNWTALFCTGSRLPQPLPLAGENIYRFAESYGYDGQFYHYVAHDPWLRHGLKSYVDAPRLRYRRILVPGLAWTLTGGRWRWVDEAYFTVILVFAFLGAWWLSRLAVRCGRSPGWGLGFALVPAALISIDRMTVDIALAALAVAFVLYLHASRPVSLGLILAAAALARETGLVLIAACSLAEMYARRFRRAALFAIAAAPALAWYGYVAANTQPYAADWIGSPFAGILTRIFGPAGYNLPAFQAGLVTGLDYLAVLGVLAAFFVGLSLTWKWDFSPLGLAIALFALLGIFLARVDAWQDIYGFSRTLTPLLLLSALRALKGGSLWYAAPLLMNIPRVLIQLAPQVLGVFHHLLPDF